MELSIDKRDLLRGLSRTHGVAERKGSMPILSNVLLATQGDEALRLSATDLYQGVTSTVPAKVVREGQIAVSAKMLHDIVRALPQGEVSITVGENRGLTIRCGKVQYKVPGFPGHDFPPLPMPVDATFAEVPADRLVELITLTHYSMSSDDTRPHLSGTLFEGKGEIVRMVTTDGHRLSKAERKVPGASFDFSMLIPHKGVTELRKLLDDVRALDKGGAPVIGIAKAAGSAFFRHDGQFLSVKLAEEQFPPYEKVIPKQHARKIVASRANLVEALRRISLVAHDKSGGVQLCIEPGLIRVQSQNPEVGEGFEEVDVDYSGDSISIGFNARYLLDALQALSHDEVSLELSGELDPGVIRPVGDDVDFVGVVMPMRI
ncbi:MAG: DNA polymerase III subunit beta [Myxococcales bacterium]|jgi:DNA polymerase-3 subunit beta|nr:DNA polymerase III subunit beta [Myxococcales bacterium]